MQLNLGEPLSVTGYALYMIQEQFLIQHLLQVVTLPWDEHLQQKLSPSQGNLLWTLPAKLPLSTPRVALRELRNPNPHSSGLSPEEYHGLVILGVNILETGAK